jgi:CRISPR-associated protein Csh1
MIQEIINYTKYLKENSPMVFEEGLEPSKGLHIFIELDAKGDATNFPGKKGVDWDYYDGNKISPFLNNIIPYEQKSQRIGTSMNKVFDKKKQIVSCSPYCISFKKEKLENPKLEGESFEKIIKLLPFYFEKAFLECIEELGQEIQKQKSIEFKNFLIVKLSLLDNWEVYNELKKDAFINFYLKNIPFDQFELAHNIYLKRNLFNSDKYNSDSKISETTYGLSGFINGLNIKKPFLEHKTASMFKGIASRILARDAIYLNEFDLLLRRKNNKVFPSPLPIFIDKNEFSNSDEIISIFKKNGKLTYSQILKQFFKNTPDKDLQNYYLLFFNYKYELEDYDFVSKFRYSLEKDGVFPKIRNLFELKKGKDELKGDYLIKNIFHFEADIVRTIFNGVLVGGDIDGKFWVNYFNDIKPHTKDKRGEELSEPIYQMILKYRKAFYDYIYKSKTQAISCTMWDEIVWNSTLGDLRNNNFDKKYYIEQSIKEKLNIWFSLYNYFTNNLNRTDMASKIPELLEKMKKVANEEEAHFETTEEFAFGSGQVIYFLLSQSKASERTHALLEPFIQKVKAEQLQSSIAQTINMYKHEISFGHGRFERLSSEVLAFETDDNLKNYQRLLLAGYFSTPVIYEKKENN